MKTCKKLLALLAVFSLVLAMMPILPANAAEEEMFDLSWTDPENEEMTVLDPGGDRGQQRHGQKKGQIFFPPLDTLRHIDKSPFFR